MRHFISPMKFVDVIKKIGQAILDVHKILLFIETYTWHRLMVAKNRYLFSCPAPWFVFQHSRMFRALLDSYHNNAEHFGPGSIPLTTHHVTSFLLFP